MSNNLILVTGGAGFIGSSLSEYLLSNQYNILCVDNFDGFYSPKIKKNNLQYLLANENFYLEEGDIRDHVFLKNIFSKYKISTVIHLASKAGVRASIDNTENYFEVNVNGAITLFEVMRSFKVKNLIFASSSSVYGNNNALQKETDCCDFQISPYATTKKTVELITYNYYTNFGFNVLNLRLFSVYGEKQRPDLFIYKIFNAIYNNEEIEIYGDGLQQRDFTHINDVVYAFYKALTLIQKEESIYEIVNIGNNKPVSVNTLVSIIEKQIKKEVKRKYISSQGGDVNSTYADITKAKRILGFSPKVNLDHGIKEFNIWYKNKINDQSNTKNNCN